MKRVIPIFTMALILVACNNSKEKENPNQVEDQTNNTENPLLSESTLAYGAPDFSKIKDDNFNQKSRTTTLNQLCLKEWHNRKKQ